MSQIVMTNGIEICVETFGDPADPAILLIAGAASSMGWWEDEFCERLAAGPRFVIRYDNRDTGGSTSYEPGSPTYAPEPDWSDRAAVVEYVVDGGALVRRFAPLRRGSLAGSRGAGVRPHQQHRVEPDESLDDRRRPAGAAPAR